MPISRAGSIGQHRRGRSTSSGTRITTAAATTSTSTTTSNTAQAQPSEQPPSAGIATAAVLGAGVGRNQKTDIARVVTALLGAWAMGRKEKRLRRDGSLRATSYAGKSSRTIVPTLQRERRKMCLPSRSTGKKKNFRPAPPEKKRLPSRLALGKNIYRPVPS